MPKRTIPQIQKMKQEKQKITMLTAYDYTWAKIIDQAGVDMVLVGDSLGMVVQGKKNTLGVTLEEIIYHSKSVSRGLEQAHLVADMPFLSYQCPLDEAVKNCGKVLKNGRAESVKLEGGEEIAQLVEKLTGLGIPVIGHIGLKPMHVHAMGGFKIQGRDKTGEKKVLGDAKALEQAGAFSIVLEGVPAKLAEKVSRSVKIPTIGIGSGNACDGQVLVIYDLLGLYQEVKPKFVRKYANLFELSSTAIRQYVSDVKDSSFPSEQESF